MERHDIPSTLFRRRWDHRSLVLAYPQNGLKNMGWGWFFGFTRFSARSGLAKSQA